MNLSRFLPAVGLYYLLIFAGGCGIAATAVSEAPPQHYASRSEKFAFRVSLTEKEAVFKAGFAKRKITPQNVQWLARFIPSRLGLFTQSDLWSKCLAMEDGNRNAVVIVSLDLLGLLPSDVKDIKNSVSGFFAGKILVTATHTHSAPDTFGIWGPGVGIPLASGRDENYVKFVKESAVECIRESFEKKLRAVLTFSKTLFENVAKNPGAEENNDLVVMRVISPAFSVILFNYALHPNLIYSSYVSGDWPYFAYEFLEKETGSEVVFVNGATGGVRAARWSKFQKRWSMARDMGWLMGQQVLAALESEKISAEKNISWRTANVQLEIKNKNFLRAAEFGLMPDQRNQDGKILTEVSYVVIGDAGIITFPGEAFPNIALPLKNSVPNAYKAVFGLTNAELGYIISSQDYNSGKYNSHVRKSIGPVGEKIGEALKKLLTEGGSRK